MMKLQPASQKELARVALVCAVCTALMLAVFALLSVAGVYPFGYPIVLGAVCGALVAIGNFAALCLTVQKIAANPEDANARAKMQLSYNARLMVQAGWCILAFVLPCFQVVASVVPLLFPRVAIWVSQRFGRSAPTEPPAPEAANPSAEAPAPKQER